MNLTREEAIRNFREHWASNAITGVDDKRKGEYLERHGYSNIKHDCFLCEFVYQQNGIRNCGICPIEWPDTKNDYPRDNHPCVLSYFGDWFQAAIPEERKRIAAIIRDLPEKQEKEEPRFKLGDFVKVIDGSWSYSIGDDGTKTAECGISLKGDFEVLQTGLNMPILKPEFYEGVPDNDTIIKEIGTGKKVSIQERFLVKVEKPAPRYQVGDKVVPVKKSDNLPLGESCWRTGKKQGYLYVVGLRDIEDGQQAYGCWYENHGYGDFFLESDLIPYVEPEKKKEPEKQDRPFQVGDRVRVKEDYKAYKGLHPKKRIEGMVGIIAYAFNGDSNIRFDETIGGHGSNNREWHINNNFLELLPPLNHCPEPKTITETTTFYFKGNKTTCVIENEQGRFKGTTKCSPQDEWSEARGMALALIRAQEAMTKAGM